MMENTCFEIDSGDMSSLLHGVLKMQNGASNVKLSQRIINSDRFIYTTLMSPSILNPFDLKKRKKWVELLAQMAPHLVLPRKTVIFSSKRQWGAVKLNDWILKNTDYDKTRLLKTESYEDFSQFATNKFTEALLTTEYQINYSRFCIELSKKIKEKADKFEVSDAEESIKPNSYVVKDFVPNNLNDIRLITNSAEIILINKDGKLFVYPVKVENEEVLLMNIQQLIPSVQKLEPNEDCFFADRSFEGFLTGVNSKSVSFDKAIKLNGAPENIAMGDYRALQDLCDEKYDIAKQTGIDFRSFSVLFFRYGEQVDELTDMAYEMLSVTRDAESIWKKCEEEFVRKYEGEIISE